MFLLIFCVFYFGASNNNGYTTQNRVSLRIICPVSFWLKENGVWKIRSIENSIKKRLHFYLNLHASIVGYPI